MLDHFASLRREGRSPSGAVMRSTRAATGRTRAGLSPSVLASEWLPVRELVAAGLRVCQLHLFAAVCVDDEDLCLTPSGAVALVGDLLAVRRPGRVLVIEQIVRQRPPPRAVRVHHEEVVAAVAEAVESDHGAVRGPTRT